MANPFIHSELNTTDLEKAKTFYGKLFDWKYEEIEGADGLKYTAIGVGETNGHGTGGGMLKQMMPGAPSAWMPYVLVDDIQAATKKARSLGATILKDVTEVRRDGLAQHLQGPDGRGHRPLADQDVASAAKGSTPMQKITPFLWFDSNAEEAANFYVSIFKDSKITDVMPLRRRGPGPQGPGHGDATFELEGQEFIALNGGPDFKFTEAISLRRPLQGPGGGRPLLGQAARRRRRGEQCGWLKDRYGLSWQIVPNELFELMTGPGPGQVRNRVMQAMMGMVKFDVEGLKTAAANPPSSWERSDEGSQTRIAARSASGSVVVDFVRESRRPGVARARSYPARIAGSFLDSP